MNSEELLARAKSAVSTQPKLNVLRETVRPHATQTASLRIDLANLLQEQSEYHEVNLRLAVTAAHLCKHWHASRVSLFARGPYKSTGAGKLTLLADSSGADVQDTNNGSHLLHDAAQEACAQTASVWASHVKNAQVPTCKYVSAAQRQLSKELGGLCLSIPTAHGVICLEFEDNPSDVFAIPWLELVKQLENQCRLIDTLIDLLQSSKPSVGSRWTSFGKTVNRQYVGRFGLGLGALVVAVLLLVPVQNPISAPARLEGQFQRQITAPTAGVLKTVHARPGDKVKAGQIVAELKERDFELERSKLQSERASQDGNYRSAMSKGDRSAMMQAQSRIEELDAQLGLIANQIENIQLRAPIDGIIISTDLAPLVGNPIERGQTIAVIAPEQSFRVVLELDERDLSNVAVGQTGGLALSARPFETIAVSVEKISPATTVTETGNTIEVHAQLIDPRAALIKPGLRGVVHLQNGKAPLATIWYRQIRQALQILIWRWAPWLVVHE